MHTHAALGGTFDHFHLGHEYIIEFALKHAEKLSIGITTQNLYKNKSLSEVIEDYSFRKKAVEQFLSSMDAQDRVTVFELNDIYGTTLIDSSLDAIVVTEETELNAHRINQERTQKGLSKLFILKCPLFLGQDTNIIRSTQIRAGNTNRAGFPYASLFSAEILRLDDSLRKELQKPLNEPILKETELKTAKMVANNLGKTNALVIGVGDIINSTLRQVGFTPDLQIVDFKTRRKYIAGHSVNEEKKRYKNDPGTLYKSAVIQIHYRIQEFLADKVKKTLIIEGEEDLLALPAILFSPLNSIVLYGQFGQGIVMVKVTEDVKEKVTSMLKKFTF